MSENAAPQNLEAGEADAADICANGAQRREKLLTTELAEECATKMFMQCAGGPLSPEPSRTLPNLYE